MNTTRYFLADSIRIASHQRKLPTDIGKFRPHTRTHEFGVFSDDDGFFAALPCGSRTSSYSTEAEALRVGRESMTGRGWTTSQAEADEASVRHAQARKNNHPNR